MSGNPTATSAALHGEPSARSLHLLADALAERCAGLSAAALEATAVQWEPAPVPRPREDTSERSKGGHGDPTSTIALDTRRLAVRESVSRSIRELEKALERVSAAEAAVHRALDGWAGNPR